MKALVIRNANLEVHDLIERSIAGILDDTPCSCFFVDGLMGFCGDTFLARTDKVERVRRRLAGEVLESAPAWNVVPEPGQLRRDVWPIAGPIVVLGILDDGSSRALTDVEIARFTIDWSRPWLVVANGARIPTLTYRRTAL